MKKLLTGLFLLPMMALAYEYKTEMVDGIEWTYRIANGCAIIENEHRVQVAEDECAGSSYVAAIPQDTVGAITVPSILDGCPVTHIGACAFSECSKLTSIMIPRSVINISSCAITYCSGLKSITIPSSVAEIQNDGFGSIFEGCDALVEILVEADNTAYSSNAGALYNKEGTDLLCFPGGIAGEVTIPVGVSNIGRCAFSGCSKLTSVLIPQGVTIIGGSAFSGCSGLTAVSIPESVTRIEGSAFSSSGLTTLEIPNGVTYIGQEAFIHCGELQSVTIGSSVREIDIYAFSSCTKLTSVTISASVKEIGHGAFMGCENLSMISVNSGNSVYRSLDGVLYDKAGTKLLVCPEGKTGAVQIPSSVTCIGTDTGWSGVDDTADLGAFERCAKLSSISIPASLTFIAGAAFSGCDNLKSIVVDADNPWYCDRDGVLYSKDMATLLCCPGGVEELLILDDVIDVLRADDWESCFALDGIGLKTIKVSESNQVYCAKDGILYSKDKTEMICCPWGRTGSVTIPYGVTKIGFMAFGNCSATSLTIPPTVTSIDRGNNLVLSQSWGWNPCLKLAA